MTVVTVSPKYQVVISKDVREKLKIKPGQKVEAFAIGSRIEYLSGGGNAAFGFGAPRQ